MRSEFSTYQVVSLGAMFLAIITTPVVIHIAKKRGIVDAPGLRKVHAKQISRIGGVAIAFSSLIMIAAVLFADNIIGQEFRERFYQIGALLVGAVAMFIIGFIDDVRGVRARVKFLVQLGAAVLICLAGGCVGEIHFNGTIIVTGEWGWLLTVIWIVGVTNAVNLIDGLDGLAAGVSFIAALAVAIFAIYTSQNILAVVMLSLLGALAGFLFLNFNPARVFMGDCGSLFLGFMIAGSSVICVAESRSIKGIALPALALGVPIFDTLFSMLRRLLQRRSLFAADQGHIHHRLLDMGLAHGEAALVIYIVSAIAASLGLLMIPAKGGWAVLVMLGVCMFLAAFFRLAGAVRLRETCRGMVRNHHIAVQARQQREGYERAELRLRKADDFENWWQAVSQTCGDLEFIRLELTLTNRDGKQRKLEWVCGDSALSSKDTLTVVVPVRDRRPGGPIRAEVAVAVDGSVESACRRVEYFGRLMDRYSLADMPVREAANADAEESETKAENDSADLKDSDRNGLDK